MFATLLGALPRPPLADDVPREALIDACLELQAEHGLEPATDGGWSSDPHDVVGSWRVTAARADRLVKASVLGPVSSGRAAEEVRREICTSTEAFDPEFFRCQAYCDSCDCSDPNNLGIYDPDEGECS